MAKQLSELFDQLRTKCAELERKNIPLEHAMIIYEESVALQEKIRRYLEVATMRVEIVNADGTIEPFTDKRPGLTNG